MKKIIHFVCTFLFISGITPSLSSAQTLAKPSIDEQFREVNEKSNNYQDYKVVKQTTLQRLWKNTNDSIHAHQKAYTNIAATLKAKDNIISQIKSDLKKKNKELEKAISSNNEIIFLGFIPLSKGTYNIMMCSIIISLSGACFFFLLRSRYSKKEAKEKADLYNEISEEFKSFKTKAHENEKKLARQLQDERNKLAEHNIF